MNEGNEAMAKCRLCPAQLVTEIIITIHNMQLVHYIENQTKMVLRKR